MSGPSFQIRESFGSGLEAERQVRRWFRRAFPGHVCDSSCEADPGGIQYREPDLQAVELGVGTVPAPATARSVCEDGDAGDLLGGAGVSGTVLFLVDAKGKMQSSAW